MSEILKIKLPNTENFSGNGALTTFTLQNTPHQVTQIMVGTTEIEATAYSVSGKNIVFATAPVSGTNNITVTYEYWTPLPTISGEDGKSAYEAAVSAGYQGTEAAFNAALASIAGKQATININGMLKGTGSGNVTQAIAGTDYVVPTGNVASATKLANARKITIGNASNKTFNGEADVSYTLAEIGAAASSHNQAANTITAGTLGGQVVANASAVTGLTTAQVRNIRAGTTDMVAGTTALATGEIYIYYEA